MRLILASASPRRRELLTRLGLPFEVVPSAVEEILPDGVPIPRAVAALALAKARDVVARVRAPREDPAVVLAADTLVVLDGRPLGKPVSRAEARGMLLALRGRAHEVMTGVAVVEAPGGREATETVTSGVVIRPLTDAEVEAYVATDEPYDKAGAYAVQGERGRGLVARVDGCYTNVVGLPIGTTARLLRASGVAVVQVPADPPSGA